MDKNSSNSIGKNNGNIISKHISKYLGKNIGKSIDKNISSSLGKDIGNIISKHIGKCIYLARPTAAPPLENLLFPAFLWETHRRTGAPPPHTLI